VLAVGRAGGLEDAVATADRLLRTDGAGGGCILHTGRPGRATRVARNVSAPRLAVNVPGTAFAGSAEARIPFTPTLGRTLLADSGETTQVARRGRA